MPLLKRHRFTATACFQNTDRVAVSASDQWTCRRHLEDRPRGFVRCALLGCAEHLDIEASDRIELCYIAGRSEGLVISSADEIDNSVGGLVPVDSPVQCIVMPVESPPPQVLRNIDERLAANDLRNDAREEL